MSDEPFIAPPVAGQPNVMELDDQLSLGGTDDGAKRLPRSLSDKFVVPPFTVLDRRQGYWQDRRRAWLSLGIQSELGRDQVLHDYTGIVAERGGKNATTSIFDPVLCEIAYLWFCPSTGHILDPFAGGSVRGIVAAALGYSYLGIDLRAEQVLANRQQAGAMFGPGGVDFGREVVPPKWVEGDAAQTMALADGEYDFSLTCPPYGNLEVYSDDPQDLSNMPDALFDAAYGYCIAQIVAKLRPNRFAAIVVGDLRGEDGYYRDFVGDTVRAFEAAGARYYNAAVIAQPPGSAPVRVGNQFDTNRKLVTLHQHLLVFVKGDGVKAAQAAKL